MNADTKQEYKYCVNRDCDNLVKAELSLCDCCKAKFAATPSSGIAPFSNNKLALVRGKP